MNSEDSLNPQEGLQNQAGNESLPTESDEEWESPWPRPLPDEPISELPDSLSWGEEVPPPVVRTKRRGTLAPGVDRPQMPISSQQKLLLLDTCPRLRGAGEPLSAHAVLLEKETRGVGAWRLGGSAPWLQERQ